MRKLIILLCAVIATGSYARRVHPSHQMPAQETDSLYTDSIQQAYLQALDALVSQRNKTSKKQAKPNPYMFRLIGPATLWNSALTQSMGIDLEEDEEEGALPELGDTRDSQLAFSEAINDHLQQSYILNPELFATTQEEVMSTSRLRSDLKQTVKNEEKLATKAEEEKIEVQIEPIELKAQKPNFWKTKGNGGLQFTQNYFSDNWYQGGEKSYSMLSLLTVDANYDNKRRIQWDNKFEAQLGFQTSESTKPKFRSTSNLLRLTSKLGVKAIGKWNYAAQLQLQSQPYMSYDGSGENVTADFLAPLYVRASIGMDYKFNWKNFSGSLYLAPFSWNLTYVNRDGLIDRYGIHEGHHSKHDWGPNVNLNFTYRIMQNITWTSRAYWFSNFDLTRIEWENTFDFKVNRYVSAKLFLYPRFEDSATKFRSGADHDGTYWMFKEFLSLGLNYDF